MSGATEAEWARFRAARPGDEDAAREMLSAHLAWRRKHLPLPAGAKQIGAGLPKLITMLGDDRRCRDGTRALLMLGAMYDPDAGTLEEYALAFAHLCEAEVSHDSTERFTVLIDGRGGDGWHNPRPWSLMPFIRTMASMFLANYPERLQCLVLYPMPWVATAVWTAASAFVDKRTAAKVRLLSGPAGRCDPIPGKLDEFVDAGGVAACEAVRAGLLGGSGDGGGGREAMALPAVAPPAEAATCRGAIGARPRDAQHSQPEKIVLAPETIAKAVQFGTVNSSPAGGLHKLMTGARPAKPAVDPQYAWITDDERPQIEALRGALDPHEREQLESEPEDIRHDLMMCRFLRGHGHSVAESAKKLRLHLKMRRDNRAMLTELRSNLPSDVEDESVDLNPFSDAVWELAKCFKFFRGAGTNDGMRVAICATGLVNIEALVSLDLEEARKFMLAGMEIRSIVLHKQSLREGRLARVSELRDWCGAGLAPFLATPKGGVMMVKVGRLSAKTIMLYPEMLASLFMCNQESTRFLNMILSVAPEETRRKFVVVKRGDWEACSCMPRGLTPSSLDHWWRHVNQHMSTDGWHLLTAGRPHSTQTLPVAAGTTAAWSVQVVPSEAGGFAELAIDVRISLITSAATWVRGESRKLVGATGETQIAGTWAVAQEGVVIMEVKLEGRPQCGLPVLPELRLDDGGASGQHAERAARVPDEIEHMALDARGGRSFVSRVRLQLLAAFVLGLVCSLLTAHLVGDKI